MALEEYRKKRDFKKTPEPAGHGPEDAGRKATAKGARKKKARAQGLSYVIQKHAATRLHYDFRLELNGVLLSWAVPKGPSLDPGEKRLAVHVEDHPLEYGDFEGVIPKGQYGGGTVLLWDQGTWEPAAERDAAADYKKGHLKFVLHGDKLRGGWNLIRMRGGREKDDDGRENWLLVKESDEEARPGSDEAIVKERPESVTTKRMIEEIAKDADRVWDSNRGEAAKGEQKAAAGKTKVVRATLPKAAKRAREPQAAPARADAAVDPASLPGARKGPLPEGGLTPQLATLVSAPPLGEEWLYEIKLDGYRVLCEIAAGRGKPKIRLWTRSRKDWTDRFAPIARAAAGIAARTALLDGEVVVLEPNGTTSFQTLQNALSSGREGDLRYYVFDLLHLDGQDLRQVPLAERKRALASLLAPLGPAGPIFYSDHVQGRGQDFYRQACSLSLEGVVAKRADAPYRPGRGDDWVKVKCLRRQELVIVGYTDPEGTRTGFGSLLLAVHDEEGKLTFAGRVGTGFDEESLRDLTRRLKKIVRREPAFARAPRGAEARRSHWVDPVLVAEVEFTEWTEDGSLRHPSFQGLREDKDASEVVREEPAPPPGRRASPARETRKPQGAGPVRKTSGAAGKAGPASGADPASRAGRPKADPEKDVAGVRLYAGVRLSHPEKVLYPGEGLTKRGLALYYESIAERMLPFLAGRPLTLVRCPDGQARECFYQKHVNDHFPASVRRVDVGEAEPYGAVDSVEGLIALVQMGVLEIHVWGSRRDRLEQPDYLVFDLDPDEGLAWERVALGALHVRERLASLGLTSFLKTTGGKGLHVCLPIVRRLGWDDVKAFAKALAEDVVSAEPALYTSILTKARRKGKVFIDYLRNGRGATSIAAYSTRARPGAPVSTPLFWEELENLSLRGSSFTVENLAARLESLAADPWAGFFKVRQSLTVEMRKALGAA